MVFVHGSGPQDRDETIGPNKVFKDLAHRLAQRGISTLRYEKRTREWGLLFASKLANWTVDDEVVDDAIEALRSASKATGLNNAGPLFLLGHSEGAYLAPRIAEAAERQGIAVAGVIMLAPPITPLYDLALQQARHILATQPSEALSKDLERSERSREVLLDALKSEEPSVAGSNLAPLPLGWPLSAWRDLAKYDPAAVLKRMTRTPALLMFFGDDYQVPASEMELWRQRLSERGDTTFSPLPGVNHILTDGPNHRVPADYDRPASISPLLIDVVATFVRGISDRAINASGP
ncbi:MAG: alpha/beta fold hydrolase [Burkholderiales bacterium]